MRIFVLPEVSSADERSRLSRGSSEVHTSHPHPMTGTPCEVPVPRSVSFKLVLGLLAQTSEKIAAVLLNSIADITLFYNLKTVSVPKDGDNRPDTGNSVICQVRDKKRKLFRKFKLAPHNAAFLSAFHHSFINRCFPAIMTNYFRLIEPYLHGNLSPEEQLAFERQLTRNPALANELTLRFSLVRVLFANPEHPFRATFKVFRQRPSSVRTGLPAWIWHACAIAMLTGLFLGNAFA